MFSSDSWLYLSSYLRSCHRSLGERQSRYVNFPSDHMVPTLVVALPLLLLSYTYFNYNFTVFVLSLSLNFHSLLTYFKIWNGRPKMVYTQTSLSLVYNLERVLIKSTLLLCHLSVWIVACLRLEPKSYSTRLYSLHRRCSFGQLLQWLSALWVVRAVCRFSAPFCVLLALLLGVGGCQMSLRAGRAALAEDVGSDAATPC